jgi:hypothetical protein
MTKKYFILGFIICVFSITSEAALSPGAISTSTGGSGRGTLEPVDSVLLNPAVVAALPSKFFSLDYGKRQWGITISDNGEEALFPAALSFVRAEQDDFKTQQLGLALSYSYKKIISVGTSVSMFEYDKGQITYDQKYRQTVVDLGIAYTPVAGMGFGLVANKIYSSDSDLSTPLQKQKTFGFGSSYTYLNFVRFRFDVESAPENKTDRVVYMGGIETFMNDWVIVRLGYQNNNVVNKNYTTAGLGFAGPQFGLHYAYISNVADNTEDQHSIDLGIPF